MSTPQPPTQAAQQGLAAGCGSSRCFHRAAAVSSWPPPPPVGVGAVPVAGHHVGAAHQQLARLVRLQAVPSGRTIRQCRAEAAQGGPPATSSGCDVVNGVAGASHHSLALCSRVPRTVATAADAALCVLLSIGVTEIASRRQLFKFSRDWRLETARTPDVIRSSMSDKPDARGDVPPGRRDRRARGIAFRGCDDECAQAHRRVWV